MSDVRCPKCGCEDVSREEGPTAAEPGAKPEARCRCERCQHEWLVGNERLDPVTG